MSDAYTRLTPMERRKYEIARELGLMERVVQVGWAGLSAKDSGRIGGKMGRKGKPQS